MQEEVTWGYDFCRKFSTPLLQSGLVTVPLVSIAVSSLICSYYFNFWCDFCAPQWVALSRCSFDTVKIRRTFAIRSQKGTCCMHRIEFFKVFSADCSTVKNI